MTSERVDKQWQSKGIDSFSTEAVLGTLNHYGVAVDEASFKTLAEKDFPMGIAREWMNGWKGKGQFSNFPASAAGLLWQRFLPGVTSPLDLVAAFATLVEQLEPAQFAETQKQVDGMPKEGARREAFLNEAGAMIAPLQLDVGGAVEKLGKENRDAEATQYAAIADVLFPGTGPALTARVKAGKGDRAGALAELKALAADASREEDVRYAVAFEMIGMRAAKEALEPLQKLQEKALADRDVGRLNMLHDAMHAVLHQLHEGTPEYFQAAQMVEAQHAALGDAGHHAH